MRWVEEVLATAVGKNPPLDALQRLPFTDSGLRVQPGTIDITSLRLIQTVLLSGSNLLLQFPRGHNQFAILAGLFAQLMRLAGTRGDSSGVDFGGPVVVVGLDTGVQERLSKLSIGSVGLGEGLSPSRVRYDGLTVARTGKVRAATEARSGVLYLNTRVGWPTVKGIDRVGVAVIDRTSFADGEILERALSWAEGSRARSIVIIGDVGDWDTCEVVQRSGRQFRTWIWSHELIADAVEGAARARPGSSLSTNPLLWQSWRAPQNILCEAGAVDEAFRASIGLIANAAKLATPWPRAVVAARKLVNGLAHSLSSVQEYNAWAALDHRTTPFSSLRNTVDSGDVGGFIGGWSIARETIWIPLRYEVLKLYEMISAENPKLFALAYAIERIRDDYRGAKVLVRVPSEAAGRAMQSDLLDLGIKFEEGPDANLSWVPLSVRLPWCAGEVVEIFAGAVAPWWHTLLWSSEGTVRFHLTYAYEARMLSSSVRKDVELQKEVVMAGLAAFHLPALRETENVLVRQTYVMSVDPRPGSGVSRDELDLSVNTGLLYDEIEFDVGVEVPRDSGSATGTSRAKAIELNPGEEFWWVREGDTVEVLMGHKHIYRPLDEVRSGDVVIVPRGEGRESLFSRLVKEAHGIGDVASFEVFLSRWRSACDRLYREAGSWADAEARLRGLGSAIGWQAIRSWALGATIGPDDGKDVLRVGQLVNDELLKTEWRRINSMMAEVRRLHVRLGNLLSAGLQEAREGSGPNVEKLSRLIGVNAAELLEEFEIRSVRSVGEAQDVRASLLRKVERRR